MSEFLKPGNNRRTSAKQAKSTLETQGPNKETKNKVLHTDGSFADLPEKEGKGSGALDGTVGRGM